MGFNSGFKGLKGTSDAFLFFGRPQKFAKPRSMNPRKARDERIRRSYLSRLARKNWVSLDFLTEPRGSARDRAENAAVVHMTQVERTESKGRMNLND